MKQTAVEWLVYELGLVEYEGLPQPEWIKHLISKAKEMEKQQIIDAYKDSTSQFSVDARIDYPKSAEQYYNETYNQ